ncbi:uncharacterized protein [Oscarella lobularis]
MSFSENNAANEVAWMKGRLQSRLDALGLEGDGERILSHSHFVTTPANETNSWISWILSNWTCADHGCGINQIQVHAEKGEFFSSMRRLDARYDWIFERYVDGSTFPLVDFKDGCSPIAEIHTGHVALVSREGPLNCTYATKFINAFKSNFSGVVVYSTPNDPLVDMNCVGDECNSLLPIRGTMISYVDGTALLQALTAGSVNLTFQTVQSPAFYFGIDGQGKVQQTGWLLYPSFFFLIWQSQWYDYWTELLRKLNRPADVLPVLDYAKMQGNYGASAVIKVPPMKELLRYGLVELDMNLSCPGLRDNSCAIWDHTVQLFICCNPMGNYCGQELGRWITPFRRRIGRWLTDVTPLLPFFDAPTCNLTMKTVPWALPWYPSLNIRLSKRDNSDSPIRVPYKVIPLFKGGQTTFNQSYNANFPPVLFTIDDDVIEVVLEAVITGHGSDNHNCGEFCVTSHRFTVNNRYANVRTFTNPTNPLGCADRVPEGVEPNEHGTWLYGRDGWCDGQEVDPWIVDITDQVNIGGGINRITYVGLFDGKTPNPTGNPGYIIMYSNIVLYKRMILD